MSQSRDEKLANKRPAHPRNQKNLLGLVLCEQQSDRFKLN